MTVARGESGRGGAAMDEMVGISGCFLDGVSVMMEDLICSRGLLSDVAPEPGPGPGPGVLILRDDTGVEGASMSVGRAKGRLGT